jgi:hypothetical protein
MQRKAIIVDFKECAVSQNPNPPSIFFSWISSNQASDKLVNKDRRLPGTGFRFPGTEIEIRFSRNDPFARSENRKTGKLVVALYAWDGNSFPGKTIFLSSI